MKNIYIINNNTDIYYTSNIHRLLVEINNLIVAYIFAQQELKAHPIETPVLNIGREGFMVLG